MAQKFELGEKVYGLYDRIIYGTIVSFKAERLGNEGCLETYKIEYVENGKKGCFSLCQQRVFRTEEEAVNFLLDRYEVSKHLRFKKEEL